MASYATHLPLVVRSGSPQNHNHKQDNREQELPESFIQPQFRPILWEMQRNYSVEIFTMLLGSNNNYLPKISPVLFSDTCISASDKFRTLVFPLWTNFGQKFRTKISDTLLKDS